MEAQLDWLKTVMYVLYRMVNIKFVLLHFQVATLQEERSTLIAETEKLNERLNQADSLEDPR